VYFHLLPNPVRLLDTRANQLACSNLNAPLPARVERAINARPDCTGIPTGARAVVGNATVVNAPDGGAGFVTLWPDGTDRPTVSNLNYVAGRIVPNAFIVGLGGGAFDVYAYTSVDFIVDITGYFSAEASDANGEGLLYSPLSSPIRLLDTRTGQSACLPSGTGLTGGVPLTVGARRDCGGIAIPASARAIVGNATVVNPPGGGYGYVTLWPSGAPQPAASSLNYGPGAVVPNAFTVGLGAGDGAFAIYAYTSVDFIVDVSGYFAP
jgi:hypothetical protein